MKAKKITLKDVAKTAGVTPATVSMVVSGKKNISEATREKILKIIEELGYYPNKTAKGLASGKTDTIAVIIPDLSANFAIEVMQGIKNKLHSSSEESPYSIQLYEMMGISGIKNLGEMFKRIVGESSVDAVIIIGQDATEKELEILTKSGYPSVVVSSYSEFSSCIYADDEKGGYIAGKYVAEKGIEKIGIVTHKKQELRTKGFIDALNEYGVNTDDLSIYYTSSLDIYAGQSMGERLIEDGLKEDIIFVASNDIVAIGIMKSLKKSGFIIPNDIALIGYDDISAAEMVTPSLTTIAQPLRDMGSKAFELVVDKIKNKNNTREEIVLIPTFVERESV